MRLGRTANTARRIEAYDLDGSTKSTSRKPGFRNVLPRPRWKELRYPVMDLGDHEARIPGSKSASAAAVSRLMEATLQSSGHAGLESETKWSRFSSSHAPHSLLLPLYLQSLPDWQFIDERCGSVLVVGQARIQGVTLQARNCVLRGSTGRPPSGN